MKFYYYVDKEGVRQGPLPLEDLTSEDISPKTLVFCKGMTNWQKAQDVADFAGILSANNSGPDTPPPPPAQYEPVDYAPANQYTPASPAIDEPAPKNNTKIFAIVGAAVVAVIVVVACIISFSSSGDYQQEEATASVTEAYADTASAEVAEAVEEVEDMSFDRYRWLQERYATEEDIEGMTSEELRIMRNFIFAYHGYIFNSDDLSEYFSQYPEYTPEYSYVTSDLNPVELENIEFIKSYE